MTDLRSALATALDIAHIDCGVDCWQARAFLDHGLTKHRFYGPAVTGSRSHHEKAADAILATPAMAPIVAALASRDLSVIEEAAA